jgi:hypothetical protein
MIVHRVGLHLRAGQKASLGAGFVFRHLCPVKGFASRGGGSRKECRRGAGGVADDGFRRIGRTFVGMNGVYLKIGGLC